MAGGVDGGEHSATLSIAEVSRASNRLHMTWSDMLDVDTKPGMK